MIDPPKILQTEERLTATIHLALSLAEIAKHMDPAIKEVMKAISEQGMQPTGPLFSFHHRMPSDTFAFEVGVPVSKAIKETGRVKNFKLPAAKVARTYHHGPYEKLADSWREFSEWAKNSDLPAANNFWESYTKGPESDPDPKAWRTELNRVLVK